MRCLCRVGSTLPSGRHLRLGSMVEVTHTLAALHSLLARDRGERAIRRKTCPAVLLQCGPDGGLRSPEWERMQPGAPAEGQNWKSFTRAQSRPLMLLCGAGIWALPFLPQGSLKPVCMRLGRGGMSRLHVVPHGFCRSPVSDQNALRLNTLTHKRTKRSHECCCKGLSVHPTPTRHSRFHQSS